jgi:hypothetical protein
MERFAYLGANAVQPHVCSGCGLLWLSVAELEGIWRLYARTERQEAVLEGELADIQRGDVEGFVVGWDRAPSSGQMMLGAAALFVPEVGILGHLLAGGSQLVGKLPLPEWLRLAEPPKPRKT